ncbi:MAG: bifunctional UDP-N-acetylglucosamine diphosphorylase/glucosamine-1-phosphate N-acetyltransferase GlmU [Pseudomonadota bacterium]
MNIVILAAGQGTRMHSALPKVLHPLAGKPMLAHLIATAKRLLPHKLCLVYGYGADQLKAAFASTSDAEAELCWVEQTQQLGTGHAVQQALPYLLDAPAAAGAAATTLVLYGDVPLLRFETLQSLCQAAQGRLAILTQHLAEPGAYGRIVRDAEARVLRIVEAKDATPSERAINEVNTGIMALPTACLRRWLAQLNNDNAQREYYLTDIVALAAAEGVDIATVAAEHPWEVLGVNDKAQLATLERVVQTQYAAKLLAQGVRLADPARLDVRGELHCGRDVFIDINAVFEGVVSLGDGVSIGPNCVLQNAQIGAGTQIAAFSHLSEVVVGEAARIGPFARLRPGTELGEGVHVGNFVELKNSQIGAQSKVNHLAYIGDAQIGRRVNVGAGTITCNYDGVNKHQTIIEDDVFIGSDSQLVAPVVVGRGATLGAGTTLTRDAPADALTVSRTRQISISDWKRPQKNALKRTAK